MDGILPPFTRLQYDDIPSTASFGAPPESGQSAWDGGISLTSRAVYDAMTSITPHWFTGLSLTLFGCSKATHVQYRALQTHGQGDRKPTQFAVISRYQAQPTVGHLLLFSGHSVQMHSITNYQERFT